MSPTTYRKLGNECFICGQEISPSQHKEEGICGDLKNSHHGDAFSSNLFAPQKKRNFDYPQSLCVFSFLLEKASSETGQEKTTLDEIRGRGKKIDF